MQPVRVRGLVHQDHGGARRKQGRKRRELRLDLPGSADVVEDLGQDEHVDALDAGAGQHGRGGAGVGLQHRHVGRIRRPRGGGCDRLGADVEAHDPGPWPRLPDGHQVVPVGAAQLDRDPDLRGEVLEEPQPLAVLVGGGVVAPRVVRHEEEGLEHPRAGSRRRSRGQGPQRPEHGAVEPLTHGRAGPRRGSTAPEQHPSPSLIEACRCVTRCTVHRRLPIRVRGSCHEPHRHRHHHPGRPDPARQRLGVSATAASAHRGPFGERRVVCLARLEVVLPTRGQDLPPGLQAGQRQLPSVVLIVLGGVVVQLVQGHEVGEVGVPADREVHALLELLVGAPV